MALILTESAAHQMKTQLASRGAGIGIRVGVTTTGCSGLAYMLEFVDQLEPHDQIFNHDGVTVVVDEKSLVYIKGTQIDFVKTNINEGFKFHNPNVRGECGCGESFTV
jgi:iron-sulfur cluster assembly protein